MQRKLTRKQNTKMKTDYLQQYNMAQFSRLYNGGLQKQKTNFNSQKQDVSKAVQETLACACNHATAQ